MVLKFYKEESIETPAGEKVSIPPVRVEDMDIVLNIIEKQKKVAKGLTGRKKLSEDEVLTINLKELFPSCWHLSQRGIKRLDPDNSKLNGENLDELPDIDMSFNYAVRLATKMIEVSMDMDDDTKKQVVEQQPKKK